ncbi:hypothetical protein SAMN05216551_109175 [Chitinasiproducens palmae]|uniref:Uncharacterized protein n=1 Tax=Chitinasiproducens palmae TaxID=1770053 RepID=A0A1H2PS89_9BURK|nr:hypothetical protein SAMN05216551_109175 [Chitinasiproducens palmae]
MANSIAPGRFWAIWFLALIVAIGYLVRAFV